MNQRDIEDRVRQIIWPAPSASLRDRILATTVVRAQPITWSDRMWFSRAWRWAAVSVALVVVVLDQISGAPRSTGFTATPQALAEAQAIDEAGREMGLPPDVAASIASRALTETSRPRLEPQAASELLQELAREGGGD